MIGRAGALRAKQKPSRATPHVFCPWDGMCATSLTLANFPFWRLFRIRSQNNVPKKWQALHVRQAHRRRKKYIQRYNYADALRTPLSCGLFLAFQGLGRMMARLLAGLFVVGSLAIATSAKPDVIDLPTGFFPEGITNGEEWTAYVGSLAGERRVPVLEG